MADEEELLAPAEITEEAPEVKEMEETVEPVEPVAETPAEPEEKPEAMVPLAAVHAEREKNKSFKDQIASISAKLDAMTAEKTAVKPPDIYEQPEAYQAYVAKQVDERVANMQAEMSERFARSAHGDEAVEAAYEAALEAKVLDQFKGRKDPWGDLAKWHKTQRAVSEIGDDPEAWRAKEREAIRQELLAENAAASKPNPALATTPSLAGQSNVGNRAAPAWSGPTPLDEILGGQT